MPKTSESTKMPPFIWGIFVVIAMLPVLVLLQHAGKLQLFLPILCAVAVIVAVIKVCWQMHIRRWFWPAIIFFAGCNGIIIALVHWKGRWLPAPLMVAGCIPDLIVILAIMDRLEKASRPK